MTGPFGAAAVIHTRKGADSFLERQDFRHPARKGRAVAPGGRMRVAMTSPTFYHDATPYLSAEYKTGHAIDNFCILLYFNNLIRVKRMG
jgi:hypothetical protein